MHFFRAHSALLKKINELLDAIKGKTQKTAKRKSMAAAKRSYKQWRKRALAAAKAETKNIKSKTLARIRRMPAAQRVPARKRLKEQLKKREDALKQRYPANPKTAEELRRIMQK